MKFWEMQDVPESEQILVLDARVSFYRELVRALYFDAWQLTSHAKYLHGNKKESARMSYEAYFCVLGGLSALKPDGKLCKPIPDDLPTDVKLGILKTRLTEYKNLAESLITECYQKQRRLGIETTQGFDLDL